MSWIRAGQGGDTPDKAADAVTLCCIGLTGRWQTDDLTDQIPCAPEASDLD
jgi:hypothetical protein